MSKFTIRPCLMGYQYMGSQVAEIIDEYDQMLLKVESVSPWNRYFHSGIPMHIRMVDNENEEIVEMKVISERTLWGWIYPNDEYGIYYKGHYIGSVKLSKCFVRPVFKISDENHIEKFRIVGPCRCCLWFSCWGCKKTFSVIKLAGEEVVGDLTHYMDTRGCLRFCLPKMDVNLNKDMSIQDKLLILAVGLNVEYLYSYEQNN